MIVRLTEAHCCYRPAVYGNKGRLRKKKKSVLLVARKPETVPRGESQRMLSRERCRECNAKFAADKLGCEAARPENHPGCVRAYG